MRRRAVASVVLALGMVAVLGTVLVSARPLADGFDPGTGSTNIIVMNVDPAELDASIVVSLYGQDG